MVSLNYYDGSQWTSFGTITSINTGTGLTGGPITTSGTISLANTSVLSGIYTYPSFTVDAQGRLVAASSGLAPVTSVGITGSTGISVSGSPITSSGTIALSLSFVPASVISGYPNNTITFLRGDGTWVAPPSFSGVTSITAGTGLSGGTITSTGTVALANTGVTAGSYTIASITVNAQGQITTASSGTAVTSVGITGSTGISVSGSPITSSGTIALTLGAELQALSNPTSTGFLVRTAANTYVQRILTASGGITVAAGSGASGNPSITLDTTLPSAVQSNITQLGTVTSGVWNGTVIGASYGGTGVNNGVKTITLGGNLITSGAFATTLTVTGATSVTLPTTGTLATTATTWGVAQGGTGLTTSANLNSLVVTGTSATGAYSQITGVVAGSVLSSNGVGVLPYWNSSPALSGIGATTSTTTPFSIAGTALRLPSITTPISTMNYAQGDIRNSSGDLQICTGSGTGTASTWSSFLNATSTINPSKISGYPGNFRKSLRGDGQWLEKDRYQTLTGPYVSNWDADAGNVAYIVLTGSTYIANIDPRNESTLILFVKQDSIGNSSLFINNIYRRNGGSADIEIDLSANALNCLVFKNDDLNAKLYLESITYGYSYDSYPQKKYIFDALSYPHSLTVVPSPAMQCRIRLLGAGGGGGLYRAGEGSSGAGGYTEYIFNTQNYLNKTLAIRVGYGGTGGVMNSAGTVFPGVNQLSNRYGIAGDTGPGGGGESSYVFINSSLATFAVAGGGGGGSGYGANGTGAGGGTYGQDGHFSGTGGTPSAGGVSETIARPSNLTLSGSQYGAGMKDIQLSGHLYDCGGGGNGWYGGGCAGGDGRVSGGGSGYVNTSISGYYSGTTYTGSGKAIPVQASSDFAGYGYGVDGTVIALNKTAPSGGNGRVTVEFL